MGTDRIRRLLTSKTAKLAQDTNTNIGLDFTSDTKPFADPNLVDIINQNDVFTEERENSTKYRVYGNVKMITTNELSELATDNNWSLIKNNWIVQILYPSDKDYNYVINSRRGTESNSEAFRGVPLQKQFIYKDTSRSKIAIQTNMKHNLQPLDFVYLYSTTVGYNNRGIHRVEKLGNDVGENINYNFVTSTIVEPSQSVSLSGNLIKMLDPSQNDIKYLNPLTVNGVTILGGLTNISSTNHQLVVNDFIEMRSGVGTLNGIFLVKEIVDNDNFKIDVGTQISTTTTTTFRRLDGTPSEYYVREFEVMNLPDDYDTYKTAFSRSIYPETLTNNFGIANGVYSYQLNKDIDVGNFTSHRGGKLTELYAGFIKISNGWSQVVSDWEDNFKSTSDAVRIELISNNTLTRYSLGDKYIGDFVEFNRLSLIESTISETIHRFATSSGVDNGYYLKPFKKLQIRVYSNVVETAVSGDNIINLPPDAITYPNGDRVWKDILSVGVFEEAVNGVDYPFKNNSHYFYNNNILYIRVQDMDRNLIEQESFKIGEVEC